MSRLQSRHQGLRGKLAIRMPRSNRGAIEAEYMKQYRARPEVKAKRAKYIKQCMKQYNVMHQAVAGERSTGFKIDAKTATRGGGGSKTATHP